MRIKAVYAISAANQEKGSLDILKEALLDEDYRVRGEACGVLGTIKKSDSSEILMKIILSDKSRYVRCAALYSIVKINYPGNVIRLFDLYSIEEDRVFKEILRKIIRTSLQKHIK